jgi:isopenicillin N synthase-like dioxygenase
MDDSAITEDDKVTAKAVSLEEIPIIDFAPFLNGDAAARQAVAEQIAWACETIGFFYLVGHGIPEAYRAAVFERSAQFFHLPVEARRQYAVTEDCNRGFIQSNPGASLTADSRVFEQYRMERDFDPADPDLKTGSPFCQLNRWPAEIPGFGEDALAYFKALQGVSRELLRAMALGLGLAEDRFDPFVVKPVSQMSMLYYPPLPEGVGNEIKNISAHTDDGPVTILTQGEVPGLEVKTRAGDWIAAPPVPGALTCNLGNMMMWWSNGRYVSTLHRVRNTSRGERFTVPFFFNMNEDAVVEPLPELVGDGEPLYRPVRVGDLLGRFYKTVNITPYDASAKV